MPLYDYKCRDCGESFEALVLRQLEPPSCPKCGKRNLEQQISMFRVDSTTTREATGRIVRGIRKQRMKDQKMDQIAAEKAHREDH
jgi:putative FmdB family regulatory protein